MNLELVEQIVSLLKDSPVSEIALERDGLRVHARKSLTPDPSPPAPPPVAAAGEPAPPPPAAEPAPPPVLLTADMVGLFRHAEPPVGYGARVAPGQVVGSIEAMKVLNDVLADGGGQVVDVLVEEGVPVEYGQPLFRLLAAADGEADTRKR